MALNRQGVSDMIRDCLRADTSVLYGSSLLLQGIFSDPAKFANAKTNKGSPYNLYIWASTGDNSEDRMQSAHDSLNVNLKFQANTRINNIKTAVDNIDLAYERIKKLLRKQMYDGTMFTDYYTDSNDILIDLSIVNSDLEPPEDNDDNSIIIDGTGNIFVLIKRFNI